MKRCLKILLFSLLPLLSEAQQNIPDSLYKFVTEASNDSTLYIAYRRIYDYYEETNRDSAYSYAAKNLLLTQKNNKKLAEVHALCNMAYQLIGLGQYAEALQNLLQAFKIAEDQKIENEKTWLLFSNTFSTSFTGNSRLLMIAYAHHIFGILMWQTDNNDQAIIQFRKAREISSQIHHNTRQMMADMNLGRSYAVINKLDSALLLENEAKELAFKINFKKYLGQVYLIMGGIYQKKNDSAREKEYYYEAIKTAIEQNNLNNLNASYFNLTEYYLAAREKDSALLYAMKNLEIIRQLGPVAGLTVTLGTVYENIYSCYKLGNNRDSLFKYQGLTLTVKDSLYKIRIKNLTAFQNATYSEQLRLQQVEKEKAAYQNKIRVYLLLGGIGIFILLAFIFYRNTRQKHKANLILEKTLDNLKSTQQQLVHSEKMASLGELTAGIAHEIQNPLNFVNNFSELNNELIEEVKNQKSKLKTEEFDQVLDDIFQNNEKITHHGKRADAIVKGMLQHSRTSSSQKELTDINNLADEYLRLAYHGLRAKDKSFNAKFETNFDHNVGKVNIIPQEIGRVILNLINNAFYTVSEKQRILNPGPNAESIKYEPTVVVSTAKLNNKVEIKIRDNGNGIPKTILEKIFQPFFTTKPTGEGTGLGLSLSYEIVKSHGGDLKVETKENEGSEFTIQLPVSG